jgi:hypothetical protein
MEAGMDSLIRVWRVIVLVGVAYAVPGGQSADPPKTPYESHGVCPFECCTYRTWTVNADTNLLVDRRDGAVVAVRVCRGQQVQGLTGVVVTTKLGRAVARTSVMLGDERVRTEDSMHVLHYMGEGVWRYWLRGRFGEAFIPSTEECRGRLRERSECDIQLVEKPETTWWARIRAGNGREGWTRQLEHFGNVDACGAGNFTGPGGFAPVRNE